MTKEDVKEAVKEILRSRFAPTKQAAETQIMTRLISLGFNVRVLRVIFAQEGRWATMLLSGKPTEFWGSDPLVNVGITLTREREWDADGVSVPV